MQVALLSGAYESRSVIASAQRCVNLYPQINQREMFLGMPALAGAPSTLTQYPTPGLTLLTTASTSVWRGLYRANNGSLYGVCGANVYAISSTFALTLLGTIAAGTNPVSMSDNGITLVLVDGSTKGYTIDLTTNAFAQLVDPTGAFVGADRVDYLDTFFIFNKPGTQTFYSSLSNSITFDPLYLANKTGRADKLVTLIVCRREIWLIGERSTEIWYNSGASGYPFQIVNGAFIEHGCAAKYSVCTQDTNVFWLSRDNQGQAIVLMGANYNALRISTHAIENAIQKYGDISDAIGHIHQVDGHTFYVLTFPSANATWVFDSATNLWHERMWLDTNGNENRVRPNVGVFFNEDFIVGDYENGKLYKYDLNNYTDDGAPIRRIRSFPHIVNELKRIIYRQFIADMQTGSTTDPAADPLIFLRWSDDRGVSWGNPVAQNLGKVGQGLVNMQWQRLGLARDRVFELSWDMPALTALNGAYIDVRAAAS